MVPKYSTAEFKALFRNYLFGLRRFRLVAVDRDNKVFMYACTVLILLHEYRFGRRIPHSAMMIAGGFTCLLVLAVPKGKL